MKRKSLSAAGAAWLLTCVIGVASLCPAQTPAPGTHEQSITHGGLTRTYRLRIPPGYDGTKPAPLVLAFHGGGAQGSAATAERGLGFNPLADKHGFIVAYPNGIDHHWNDGRISPRFKNEQDDVGFVSALIEHLATTLNIDRRRIYATGNSNGGFFTHRLGWELADKLAAIAPGASTMGENMVARFAPKQPISVLYLHGTKDPAVPFDGGEVIGKGGLVIPAPKMAGMWAKANGCPAKPKVEQLPDKDPNDGTTVRRETYAPCKNGTEVVFYVIEGHGHNWPGRAANNPAAGPSTKEIKAAEVVWEFFAKHPKAAANKASVQGTRRDRLN